LENYAVTFMPVRPLNIKAHDWFNMARAYYGHADFPAIQMIWPDPEGRVPGDSGYDSVRFRQPLLH
jgi:hypothetical protein